MYLHPSYQHTHTHTHARARVRTHAYTPHTSTLIHANAHSPPHTRKRTHPYVVLILPFYPYLLVHSHTPTHIPRLLIFTFGLLFHSEFRFLTRLCPFHEPGGLWHFPSIGLVIHSANRVHPGLGSFWDFLFQLALCNSSLLSIWPSMVTGLYFFIDLLA